MGKFSLVTGPGVQCFINGNLVGEVNTLKWSSSTPKREIRGIDSQMPYELAPGIVKVAGAIGMFRKVGLGGLEGMGITASFADSSIEAYQSIRVVQRRTGTVLFQCDYAAITGQEWEVAARAIMTGHLTFEGIAWHNEVSMHPTGNYIDSAVQ